MCFAPSPCRQISLAIMRRPFCPVQSSGTFGLILERSPSLRSARCSSNNFLLSIPNIYRSGSPRNTLSDCRLSPDTREVRLRNTKDPTLRHNTIRGTVHDSENLKDFASSSLFAANSFVAAWNYEIFLIPPRMNFVAMFGDTIVSSLLSSGVL